jgi:hypothetical protein
MKNSRRSPAKRKSQSLEWIHKVRRERQKTRRGRPAQPLPRAEAEKLARRYGLKLARPASASR